MAAGTPQAPGAVDSLLDSSSGSEDSLVWKILDYLREKRFEPGDRLPGERSLATRFGVGRNTLREAFAALIALRVLESKPHSGIYLRKRAAEASFETVVLLAELGTPPSSQEVLDSIEVRQVLELEAAQLACARRTETDIEKLTDIVNATNALLKDEGNIADLDHAFHMTLAESTHNTILARILHAFYRLSLERRYTYFSVLSNGRRSAASHEQIVEAISRQDPEQASALMAEHLTNARYYWREMQERTEE
ncbi:MAG: FadR/GntR family transcriptional regulator [Aquisalimonadaceae bacterium]